MTFTGKKAETLRLELTRLNDKLIKAIVAQDKQAIDYLRFEMAEVGQGRCPSSGYTFERCSASVCDCGWETLPWVDDNDQV